MLCSYDTCMYCVVPWYFAQLPHVRKGIRLSCERVSFSWAFAAGWTGDTRRCSCEGVACGFCPWIPGRAPSLCVLAPCMHPVHSFGLDFSPSSLPVGRSHASTRSCAASPFPRLQVAMKSCHHPNCTHAHIVHTTIAHVPVSYSHVPSVRT